MITQWVMREATFPINHNNIIDTQYNRMFGWSVLFYGNEYFIYQSLIICILQNLIHKLIIGLMIKKKKLKNILKMSRINILYCLAFWTILFKYLLLKVNYIVNLVFILLLCNCVY